MFQTKPLHQDFGVEIVDVDLRQLDDDGAREIERLWTQHPVLLIRNQLLDETEQVRFSKRFGKINLHVRTDIRSRSNPEVVLISNLRTEAGANIGALASGEASWHMDSCYKPDPDTGCLLYAVEVPASGGRTSWSNLQLAYESLDEGLQQKLQTMRGQFAYQIYSVDKQTEEGLKGIRTRTPDVVHPIVLTAPTDGRKSLYVDPMQTFGIDSLDPAQADEVLEDVKRAATRPEFVWEHTWQMGDLVMWDNARVLHRREPFDETVPRLLKRTTIFLSPEKYPTPQGEDAASGVRTTNEAGAM